MESGINKFYVGWLSIIAAIGGFLQGFDSASISGAIPFFNKVAGLNQSSFWFGFSVGALSVGFILGNLVCGILADKFGRKIVLIFAALLFAYCEIVTGFSNNLAIFIISRLVGGLGMGMIILLIPLYISEVSPPKYRGIMVSINQLNVVLGVLAAFFIHYIIDTITFVPDLYQRWMPGIAAVPAVAYFFLLFFIPRSPRWLMQQGRRDEAGKVLHKIGGQAYSEGTLKEIALHIESDKMKPKNYIREFVSKEMRFIIILGLGIAALQQVSATKAILYYSALILRVTGGVPGNISFMPVVLIGTVNLVFTVLAMSMVDRFGRRPLLIIGLTGIVMAYLLSSVTFFRATYKITSGDLAKIEFQLAQNGFTPAALTKVSHGLSKMEGKVYVNEVTFFTNVRENAGSEYDSVRPTVLQYCIDVNFVMVLIGILLFMASFAISLGTVTWVLLSEIFPNRVRGMAISIAGTFNSLAGLMVIGIFPAELAKIGTGFSFLIFAILCALGLLFVIKFVPETKGRSLEEIQIMFEEKVHKRQL